MAEGDVAVATKGSASPARTCKAGIRVVLSRSKGARTYIPMPTCHWLQTALGRGMAWERWLSSARSWRTSSLFTVRNWVACQSKHSTKQRLELGKEQKSASASVSFPFLCVITQTSLPWRSMHGHGHFWTCVLPAQLSPLVPAKIQCWTLTGSDRGLFLSQWLL